MPITLEQICRNEKRIRKVLGCKHPRLRGNVTTTFFSKSAGTVNNPAAATEKIGMHIAGLAIDGQSVTQVKNSIWRKIAIGRRNIEWDENPFLHRMEMLNPLTDAYAATGEEKYAAAIRDYIEDWIDRHPTRPGWETSGRDSTLPLSIRVNLWTGHLPELSESKSFDRDFVEKLTLSCACQLDFLARHPAACYNIRFTNADCLLFAGLRLADMPESELWRNTGVWMLNDAVNRQFYEDGAHIELNHNYNQTGKVLTCLSLQSGYPELGLRVATERLARMQDYSMALLLPNGDGISLNDSLYHRHAGPRPRDWAQTYFDFRKANGFPLELPPTTQNFPVAGQAFWRSDWKEDAILVVFDAGRWARYHTHLGKNSVWLSAFGRNLLIDPGYLSYDHGSPWTFHGKSTRAHNTININGWNQCDANPECRFDAVPGYDVAIGYYTAGYWSGRHDWGFKDYDPARGHGRGIWGTHHRTLLWARNRFVLIIDRVVHGGLGAGLDHPAFLESNWQFTPGNLSVDGKEKTVHTNHADGNVLMLFPLCSSEGGRFNSELEFTIHEGEKNPLRGWTLLENEHKPIPQLCCTLPRASAYTDLATVIIPYHGRNKPQVIASAEAGVKKGMVTLTWADGTSDHIVWSHCLEFAIDDFEDGRSDGSLLCLKRAADGSPREGMAFGATVVEPFAPAPLPQPGMLRF